MPDWTYHPFFMPLLLRLPAEDARRVTIGLLALQAKTSIGRRIFRIFGHGIPPAELAVTAFGVRFPAPVGIAPGIDVDAEALSVLQYLGVGYVAAGPAAATARVRTFDHDPIRIRDALAIARSPRGPCSSASEVARRVAASPALEVPIGIAVDGDDLASAARDASAAAAFVILPAAAGLDERDALRRGPRSEQETLDFTALRVMGRRDPRRRGRARDRRRRRRLRRRRRRLDRAPSPTASSPGRSSSRAGSRSSRVSAPRMATRSPSSPPAG